MRQRLAPLRALPAMMLIAAGLALSTAAAADRPAPTSQRKPMHQELDAELAAVVADPAHPLSGLAVLAVRDGKVVFEGQYGRRRIDPAHPAGGEPVTADTLFRIASVSKFVVAIGAMRLVEQGRLELDRDVGDYLGYPLRNPHFPDRAITLRMLMSHTSSLRDDGGYSFPADVHLKDVLLPGGARHRDGAMWAKNAAPGVYFTYCNFNWGVVGTVMEAVTGERFDRLMKTLVLDPLGVPGGFNVSAFAPAELASLATLYRKRSEVDGKEIWDSAGPWVPQVDDYGAKPPAPPAGLDAYRPGSNASFFSPQGGLRTSARGLGRIMLMLMHGGRHEGRPFLRAATVDALFAEQWRYDAAKRNGDHYHGLFRAWANGPQRFLDTPGVAAKEGAVEGDRLVEGGGFAAVGHLGDAYGLKSAMVFDRKSKNGMISIVGGVAIDPETTKGRYSSLYRFEERVLTALHRHAIAGKAERRR